LGNVCRVISELSWVWIGLGSLVGSFQIPKAGEALEAAAA